MKGPPYAVSAAEVRQHYNSDYSINRLEQNDVLDERPRWRDQGLTRLTETIFVLNSKNS
jgi:thiopurine S-methyltransferase